MQVGLINNNSFNYYNNAPQEVNFGAAKDINLRYILRNRAHLLPKRMKVEVEKAAKAENLPTLQELHTEVYSELMGIGSLKELKAKKAYPEFDGVVDFATVADKFPRIAPKIAAQMTYDKFSLDLLKKVWSGMTQDEIAKSYGFSGRGPVSKLCAALNIPKPEHNYLTLLKTSTEAGNQKVADETRKHIDVCIKNLALANISNKTPEARANQAASMVRHYNEHPEARERVAQVSRLTWEKCPEIRAAKIDYFSTLSSYQKVVLQKQSRGETLTFQERRVIAAIHKQFWDSHSEFKPIYAAARREAAREVKLASLTNCSGNVDA